MRESGIIDFLCSEHVGISSKAMCRTAMGNITGTGTHPRDPADFDRCLLCIEYTGIDPSIMISVSKEWKNLAENWSRIENCFIEEAGKHWSKNRAAPKTYQLMKKIIEQ